MYQSELVIQ